MVLHFSKPCFPNLQNGTNNTVLSGVAVKNKLDDGGKLPSVVPEAAGAQLQWFYPPSQSPTSQRKWVIGPIEIKPRAFQIIVEWSKEGYLSLSHPAEAFANELTRSRSLLSQKQVGLKSKLKTYLGSPNSDKSTPHHNYCLPFFCSGEERLFKLSTQLKAKGDTKIYLDPSWAGCANRGLTPGRRNQSLPPLFSHCLLQPFYSV